jgi:serine/threonine protein kinase
MKIAHWESVKSLLHQALQLPVEQRAPFLDAGCASNHSLRAEIESLLAADEKVRASFMESPPLANRFIPGIDLRPTLEPGQIFAQRFQLVRKLGEGGMGEVWLADQISPVRRQVALKLIKAGIYDTPVVQRFQSERQSLAIMDHPAIAKVFEAGATEQGQPFFVMEYVSGMPITDYCDLKKLMVPQRLELFIQACEGVQHAHQKAIIHRDLKPANILVVEVDGKPLPRIIDFGLAKATTPSVDTDEAFTRMGSFVGTPAYMSPEQADPAGQDIDTRTDVYSLGVVLYVLLTGMLPLDMNRVSQSLAEMLRTLREEEPQRPSTRVSSDRAHSATAASSRAATPAQLASQLRGDLDWISMKALEKDRARRYGIPSELAADIRRHLQHVPVQAGPVTTGYRIQKYARRHRVGVTLAAILVLILAGFAVLEAVQLRRITRERDRANRITDFMTGMFKVSDPSEARGNSITAREILDKASNDMASGLAKDPEVQAQMMAVMARTYHNLGLYARARDLGQSAFDARLNLFGDDDPRTLESAVQLGWTLDRGGRYSDAEKLERQALVDERRVLGSENPLTIETMDHLSVILEDVGNNDEAEKMAREAIELGSHVLGQEHAQTLLAVNHLGRALWFQSRYPEAEEQYRRLLDVDRRVLGADHPQTLAAMNSLAVTLMAEHQNANAEEMYREVLAVQQRILGPEHQGTALTLSNLVVLLNYEGRLAEAEELGREALRIRMKALGPEHPETLAAQTNLADTILREGRFQEAEKIHREAMKVQARVLGPENPDFLRAQSNLAGILIFEGRYCEAEAVARKTLAVQILKQGLLHPDSIDTRRQVGMAMAHSHRYSEALDLFHEVLAKENDPSLSNRWAIRYALACVAAADHRTADALHYLHDAVDRGFSDSDFMTADDDLKGLRENLDFQKLAAQLRQAPTRSAP